MQNDSRTAAVTATLSSENLVVGEKAMLNLELQNVRIIGWPEQPEMHPLVLERRQQGNVRRGGYIREVYQYFVSGLEPGLHTIPSFKVVSGNRVFETKPFLVRVHPVEKLKINGLSLGGGAVTPYLSGIFLEKNSPFLGETQSVEAKLYLAYQQPDRLRITDPRIIEMEKDGLAAWRFAGEREATGILVREGTQFLVTSYRSSINALREGTLTLGPGKAQTFCSRTVSGRGMFVSRSEAHDFNFPSVTLNVRPLPAGAPAGFAGAVGNFTLTTKALNTEINLGDTITVEAKISGQGNLDQFSGPVLVDPEGHWKQFEMAAKPQGGERRSSIGTVEFSQVIRPIKNVGQLPPYRFVFFDPVLEKFRTLNSPPQPLKITGTSLAMTAKETGGLQFLTPGSAGIKNFNTVGANPALPWLWQILPAGLFIAILALWMKQRMAERMIASQPVREFQNELGELSKSAEDRVQFYRLSANFATRWRGGENGDLQEIFETRDAICFAPDLEPEPLETTEKNRILNLLKSLSPVLLIGLLLTFQTLPAHALDPADPEGSKAEIIREMASNPTPEHFYNLALCEEALKNPGPAVLWAARFEAQGGDASELLNRLPGIHREKLKGTELVAILPKQLYLQLIFAGAWGVILIFTVLLLRPGKLRSIVLPVSSTIAALGLVLGISGWFLYPEPTDALPIHRMSVVTTEVPLQSQPYKGGKPTRANLVGSICHVTKTSGEWSYIQLSGGLSGWVSSESLETVDDVSD